MVERKTMNQEKSKKKIKIEKTEGKIKNVKIVANLPYYITTPIIMKLLEEELELESIKSLNCLINLTNKLSFGLSFNLLAPYFSFNIFTSSSNKPRYFICV